MPSGSTRLMTLFLGIISAAVIAIVALWWVVRTHIIPPVNTEVVSTGLELDAKRSNLRSVSISVNGLPWIDLGNVSESSVLSWSQLGLNPNSPNVQQVSIVGQAGSRWFESHISFGSTQNVAEYASQTWRYINPRRPSN